MLTSTSYDVHIESRYGDVHIDGRRRIMILGEDHFVRAISLVGCPLFVLSWNAGSTYMGQIREVGIDSGPAVANICGWVVILELPGM